MDTYPVGQAPWEINTASGTSPSTFAVGSAPWETGGETTPSQSPATPSSTDNTYGALLPASQVEESDNPILSGLIAGGKAAVNLPTSAFTFLSGIGNAVLHPIKTAEGLGNALAGAFKEGSNALGVSKYNDTSTEIFDVLAKNMIDRYGSLDALRKTATNDPFGFGSDVLAILEGGAGLADRALGTTAADIAANTAREGFENFNKTGLNTMPQVGEGTVSGGLHEGLSTGAQIAMTPAKAILGRAYNLGTGVFGKGLGTEGGVLRQAITTSLKGSPDAYQSFITGLTGNTSQEDLVNQARDALHQVVTNRSDNYQEMLSTIKADPTTYDISPVLDEFNNQLKKFGITMDDKRELDFSRSTIADTSDEGKINKIYGDIKSWGTKPGDRTAAGLDTLKRRIGNYFSPTSDVRALVTATKGSVSDVLENAPGYTTAMKNYSEMSDQINDITKNLSLGDNVMVETTFKKLMGSFRQNNEFRSQLIQELDQVTGGQLLPKIAGQQLSSWVPRGLMGTLETGGLGYTALNHGAGIIPLLGTMMLTSPKLVGQFIRTLRLPSQGYDIVMGLLDKMNTPLPPFIAGGSIANKVPTDVQTSNPQIPLLPRQ